MGDRRYLITIGSPECPGFGLAPLPRVAGDVEKIARFFTGPEQGYERALELPLGPTASQIRDGVDGWFAHEDRREDDCVVVYVAGHGDSGNRFKDHCLLARDSDPRRESSVLRTSELARWFFGGEGTRPQSVLLILDVCYAGQGAGEAGAELVRAEARALRGGGAGFWVLATSDPNTEAGDGAFVEAFLDVMEDEDWVPRGGARFLSPASLSVAVNAWFADPDHRHEQRALFYTVGGGRMEPPFLRNPRFTPGLDGLSVADLAHWDPKARGVDAPGVPGWFFTGRRQALRELSSWLQAETSDLRARVVTGGPGSGKSAVLGWLVLASRAETRQGMREAGLLADPFLIPSPGAVAARVHARGLRLDEMTAALAAPLSSAAREPSDLIADLSSRPGPIGIVVDSLDEAAEAVEIERELLAGLAACPPVRLIVGGRRRNGRPPLEGVASVVDLDDARYFERADLTAYVFSRLTAPSSTYAAEALHVHARRIAAVVAERAGYSFLYTRLVSRTLAQSELVDTQADLKLPADLADAFGADLDRFDPETRKRFVDLLVPLAYARGKGLPQKNVWAAVASRIAGRVYTNADLRELKEQAGYYLVQDTESGEVVFRLFHQTFADHLKDLTRDEGVERSFAEALLALLPSVPSGVEPWSQAGEPYLLNHFPSHAGAGGLLDGQLGSPGFLLHVSPEALLPERYRAASSEARKAARAYRRASHWIRAGDRDAAFTYLLWGAYQHGAHELAERLRAIRPRLPWHPEWAAWQTLISGHVLGRTDTKITALTAGQDRRGNPVALCGYDDGAIRAWNLVTSEMQTEIEPPGPRAPSVKHVALATAGGRRLIVAAWGDGSLGVFDLQDGASFGDRAAGKEDGERTKTFCVVPTSSDDLLVTGTDGFSLRAWRLPKLELLWTREKAVAASFFDLVALELAGEAAVVSGTDTFHDGENTELLPIRVWRVRDLDLLRSFETGIASQTRACVVGGTNWIVVLHRGRDVLFLNPLTDVKLNVRMPWGSSLSGILGFHRQSSDVLLIGQYYSRLRVLRLRPRSGETLDIEDLPVRTEIRGDLWSEMVDLNGRPTLVSSDDRQLRIWDVQELLEADPGGLEQGSLVALAAGTAGDTTLATSNVGPGFSDLHLWDAEGKCLWSRRFLKESLQNLAMTEVDGSPAIAWGTGEGLLHISSALDGTDLRDPVKVGEEVTALAVRTIKGTPIAFLAVNLKPIGQAGEHVVRIWDLATGNEIDTTLPRKIGLRRWKWQSDKALWCVDALDQGESTLVAFAGPYGEVRVVELESLEEVDRWYGGVGWDFVHRVALGLCEGRALVFGGDENGRLFGRDLSARQDLGPRLDTAHRRGITALLVRQTEMGTCVVSGGADGFVKFWRTDLTPLARIETERPISGLAFLGPDRLAVATDRGLTLLRLDWKLLFAR